MSRKQKEKKLKFERIECILIGMFCLMMSVFSYFSKVEVKQVDYIEVKDVLIKRPLYISEGKRHVIEFRLHSKIHKHAHFQMNQVYSRLDSRQHALIDKISIGDSISLWVSVADFNAELNYIPSSDIYGPERLNETRISVYGVATNNQSIFSLENYERYLLEDKAILFPFLFVIGLIFIIPHLIYKDKEKGFILMTVSIVIFGIVSLIVSTAMRFFG